MDPNTAKYIFDHQDFQGKFLRGKVSFPPENENGVNLMTDVHKTFLQDEEYIKMQGLVAHDLKKENQTVSMRLQNKQCDFINNVSLIISNHDTRTLNQMVKSIKFTGGTQEIDSITKGHVSTIENVIKMKSKLLGLNSEVQYHTRCIFVPLVLSPFLESQLLSMDLYYHDLEIIVEFEPGIDIPKMDIVAQKYFMKQGRNTIVIDNDCLISESPIAFSRPVSMLCPQTLFYEKSEKITGDQIRISCPMKFPTSVLMLWSAAFDDVVDIEISLDEHVLYHGTVESLQAYTHAILNMRNKQDCNEKNPLCFFMCDPKTIPDAGISSNQILPNLSTANDTNIVLKMKEGSCQVNDIFTIDIATLSYNCINFINNMCGMAFA